MRPFAALVAAALLAFLARAGAEGMPRLDPRPEEAGTRAAPHVALATVAGARAAAQESTLRTALLCGGTSLLVPGAGAAFLLAGRSAAARSAERARGRLGTAPPEVAAAWARAYERSLLRRRTAAVLLSTLVGSVLGYFLLYRHRTL